MLKKRFFLFAVVIVMAAAQAFAGGQSNTAGGKERIRVVTYFAGSDAWAPVWKESIAEYQRLNPNIEIVDESQPTSGANDLLRTKVQTDIAAKTPADILLFFNGNDGQTIIDSGLYVDWTSYMNEDKAWSANLKAGAMEAGRIGNIQYCIPFLGYYEGLFYNKALFDKFNLKEPTTWQNLLDCIDTFKANGIVPFATPLGRGATYLVELVLLAQVGPEGQQRYFDDSWAPALNAVKTLYDRGAFQPDSLTATDDDTRTLFMEGKAAMMANGSWAVNAIKGQPGMRLTAFPTLPGGSGGEKTTIAGFGSGWYLSKAASQRSPEALKFVKWITSPAQATKFLAFGGSSAIVASAPEGATPLEISAIEMLNKAVNTRPAADSQVIREAWVTLTQDGIPYLVGNQRTALETLKMARDIEASAR
jgi:raffinose/stachyose/melibiose transport system substrate-binding protein